MESLATVFHKQRINVRVEEKRAPSSQHPRVLDTVKRPNERSTKGAEIETKVKEC